MSKGIGKKFKIYRFIPALLAIVIFGLLLIIVNRLGFLNNSFQSSDKFFNKTNTINLSSTSNDFPFVDYWRSQIVAPGYYFVTDDEMLASYDSQGGMAPPRLILMKNHQVLGNEAYFDYLKKGGNDCIFIWSTGSFSFIDDWNSGILGIKGEMENKETLSVGKRNADLYLFSRKEGDIYVAYLQVVNKDKDGGLSYYFNTCNTNNKSDFVSVIKSIKFRGDLKF